MTDYLNRLVTLEHILNTRVAKQRPNHAYKKQPSASELLGKKPISAEDTQKIRDILTGKEKPQLNGVAECVICYDEDAPADMLISKLTCGHEVHDECIQEWFKHSRTCPICRRPQ